MAKKSETPTVRIGLSHPQSYPASSKKLSFEMPLQGTSPEFGFIWIDDVCYTLSKSGRGFKLKRTR